MSAVELSLNYEDLLQTVRESDRGRWFLTEYENRLRKSDSASILASIAKLENVISGMGPASADAALVARAKAAIAAARREIAAIDKGKAEFSDEGRLFSKLADMARSAFSSDNKDLSPVNAGVCRALLLVDQLDQDFSSTSAEAAKPAMPKSQLACFAADADVFDAPAKPVQPIIKPAAKDVERGARLVIRKIGQAEAPVVAPENPTDSIAAAPEPAPVSAPLPSAEIIEATKSEAVSPAIALQEKPSRVVIIRRKPEELMEVPLVDSSPSETAA